MATLAVLGAGSWGTALALLLARNGHAVRLWGHDPAQVARLATERENAAFLPGVTLPGRITPGADLAAACSGAAMVLVVVPSHAFVATLDALAALAQPPAALAWATKGLEPRTGRFLHEVARERLGSRPLAVVSGPNFAREVARGLPTATTVASLDAGWAATVAGFLHGRDFRAYTVTDVSGVELGGAVKNVLAIACGVADGLGYGANARAALITRGLAEMVRLGLACGGRRETFMGLAGVGDLVLTCTDDQSRNRRFGLALGRGAGVGEALAGIGQVVEGAAAVAEVLKLARSHGVEMPISEQVEAVVHGGRPPAAAVEALLAREPRDDGV
ncbi:NAD(P)H-dependent glycerol-3-phosphate dehydrogenase [Plasticicumulans sp.]|uniref:NAD(P)H-dependent glycerol-3-phosphate dehydrogenase n=1 Tax=Plasticicumulans sp. TaxID=2307179 RepID=UPI00392D9182